MVVVLLRSRRRSARRMRSANAQAAGALRDDNPRPRGWLQEPPGALRRAGAGQPGRRLRGAGVLLGPNGIGKSTSDPHAGPHAARAWGSVESRWCGPRVTVGLGIRRGASPSCSPSRRPGVESLRRPAGCRTREGIRISGWLGGLSARDRDVVSWAIEAVGANHLSDRDFRPVSPMGSDSADDRARLGSRDRCCPVLDEPTWPFSTLPRAST